MKKLIILTLGMISTSVVYGADYWDAGVFKDLDSVKQHLASGAPINAQDSDGYTPVMKAAMFAKPDIVAFLIEKGADVKVGDRHGINALIWVAAGNPLNPAWARAKLYQKEYMDVAKILIAKGINIDHQSATYHNMAKPGETALIAAASRGKKDLVAFLLEKGANPLLKDNDGGTALSIARKSNYPEVVALLENAEKGKAIESKE